MPRPCFWTRKLELELVEFIRQREFVWKATGNTNHHIELKYMAYAEFASRLGGGFTARSVRDRWVNIRSTFNHIQRKVEKSRASADCEDYVPCWPLWKPLQFLKSGKDSNQEIVSTNSDVTDLKSEINIKEETKGFGIRQRGPQTNRPRLRTVKKSKKCIKVLDNLIESMKPLTKQHSSYYFFGKHIVERLNNMREVDAGCAVHEILNLINGDQKVEFLFGT